MWLFVLACTSGPTALDPTAPSARLALRTGALGREARTLAVEISELDGLFDQIRAVPPEQRTALVGEIRARTRAIKTRAQELKDGVAAVEAAAQVY